jgi:serine acetyltransferase
MGIMNKPMVEFEESAAVLGPIRIGSNSIIGANAVVTKSVPENSVVGTFRAEIVAKRANDESIIRDNQKRLLSRHEISEKISAL